MLYHTSVNDGASCGCHLQGHELPPHFSFPDRKKSTKEFHVYPWPWAPGTVSMSEHASFGTSAHNQCTALSDQTSLWLRHGLDQSCHLDRLLLRSARRPSRMRSIHSGSFPAQLTSIMWALDIRVMLADFALPLSSWRVRAHRVDDQPIARCCRYLSPKRQKKLRDAPTTMCFANSRNTIDLSHALGFSRLGGCAAGLAPRQRTMGFKL